VAVLGNCGRAARPQGIEPSPGLCAIPGNASWEIPRNPEQFGLGLFDDDLAERARRAGFELAVALDLFD
jgi:hypothetical protein